MSQNSLTLPTSGTVSGLQMTQNINNALDTLNTLASGASAPGGAEAGQLWHDTTNNIIKIRSLDNTAWIALLTLNESSYTSSTSSLPAFCGFVNKFRNPGMTIAQRGASGTITAGAPAYALDGWILSSSGANITWAQSGVLSLSQKSLTITGNTSVTGTLLKQRIEGDNSAPLGSANTTFQARIQNNTGGSITPTLTIKHAVSVDDWSSTSTDVSAVSLQSISNGATGVVSYSYTSASGANGVEVTIDFGGALNNSSKNIVISELDIRSTPSVSTGLNSSPSVVELRPAGIELVDCQRYYQVLGGLTSQDTLASGYELTSATAQAIIPVIPVQMRIAPTVGFTAASTYTVNQNGVANAVTAISSGSVSKAGNITLSVSSTGLISGPIILRTNSTSGFISLTAEL